MVDRLMCSSATCTLQPSPLVRQPPLAHFKTSRPIRWVKNFGTRRNKGEGFTHTSSWLGNLIVCLSVRACPSNSGGARVSVYLDKRVQLSRIITLLRFSPVMLRKV